MKFCMALGVGAECARYTIHQFLPIQCKWDWVGFIVGAVIVVKPPARDRCSQTLMT